MSWDEVVRWVLRCDGKITHDHQCPELYPSFDEDGGQLDEPSVWSDEERDKAAEWLRSSGWMALRDGRVLCPRHVAAGVHLAQAAWEGLPFDEPYLR